MNMIKRTSVNHSIFLLLSLFYQYFIKVDSILTGNTAADIRICLFVCSLIYRYSLKFFAKHQMVRYVFILGQLFENQAQDLFELTLFLRLHVTSDVISLDLKLPLETSKLISLFVNGKSNRVHVKMDRKLVRFFFLAIEIDLISIVLFGEWNGAVYKSELGRKYLRSRVCFTTSKRVPLTLKSAILWSKLLSRPSIFLKNCILIYIWE